MSGIQDMAQLMRINQVAEARAKQPMFPEAIRQEQERRAATAEQARREELYGLMNLSQEDPQLAGTLATGLGQKDLGKIFLEEARQLDEQDRLMLEKGLSAYGQALLEGLSAASTRRALPQILRRIQERYPDLSIDASGPIDEQSIREELAIHGQLQPALEALRAEEQQSFDNDIDERRMSLAEKKLMDDINGTSGDPEAPSRIQELQYLTGTVGLPMDQALASVYAGARISDVGGARRDTLGNIVEDPETTGKIEGTRNNAQENTERAGFAASRVRAARDQYQLLSERIDELIEQSGGGLGGNVGFNARFSGVPGTASADLAARLSTLEANAAFDALQKMRDSSPTGGALGQVTERELGLLQSTLAALSQSQSEKQFDEELVRFKQQYESILQRVEADYERQYGQPLPLDGPSPTDSPAPEQTDDDIEWDQ